jgi:hypothetical protein
MSPAAGTTSGSFIVGTALLGGGVSSDAGAFGAAGSFYAYVVSGALSGIVMTGAAVVILRTGVFWRWLGWAGASIGLAAIIGSAALLENNPLQCVALQLQCTHWEDPFVDDQITVRLPTPLGRALRRTSRRLGRRPSHVVRMALEAFLQGAPSADGKRAERVEHLIGSLSSGIPDLAERHREYVLASLKHAR